MKNFTVDMDSELHGFGGYFECTLYKDVMISITPQTHSPGMFFNITRSSESEVDKIKIYWSGPNFPISGYEKILALW